MGKNSMVSFAKNFLSSKNYNSGQANPDLNRMPSPSWLQAESPVVLPPLSKDMDFKNFWVTFLRYFNRKMGLDLDLMKARRAVEEYRPEEALFTLERVDLAGLAPFSQAIYYCLKGQAGMLLKEFDTEIEAFRQAIRVLEIGEPLTSLQIMWVRNWIAIALYEQGKIIQSLEELRLCLKGNLPEPSYDDNQVQVKFLLNLGHIYLSKGQNDLALDYYGQTLSLIRVKGEKEKIELAGIYWGLGLAYRGKENLAQAKLFLKKSLALFSELEVDPGAEAGDLARAARVRNLLGLVMLEREEFVEAEQTLREALITAGALQATKKDYVALASISANLANLFKLQERWPEAREWATISLGYAEKLTEPILVSRARVDLAEINLGLGRQAEAIKLFNSAISAIEQFNAPKGSWQIYYRYGTALRNMGQLKEASDILSRGYILT